VSNWRAIRAALQLLSRRDVRVLAVIVAVQFFLSLLDLVAVVLIGLVAALSAASVSGVIPPLAQSAIDALGLNDSPVLIVALVMAVIAGLLFITKSILSFFVMRRAYRFLANRQAVISGTLVSLLFTRSILQLQKRSSQETSYALVQGANAATLGVLGSAVAAASELVLVAVLFLAVLLIDPVVAVFAVGFFLAVAFVLHRLLTNWVARMGQGLSDAEIASVTSLQESLRTYREITVTYRRGLFVERFRDLRWRSASFQADIQISQQIAKYVFEVALIIGAALLAYSQFLSKGLVEAVAVIAVFLAATSRVTPALLRLQSALLSMRSSTGLAEQTFSLARDLVSSPKSTESQGQVFDTADILGHASFIDFVPALVVDNLTFTYPDAPAPALRLASLSAPAGTSLAIVGPTGAGKSTLVDLILGILQPDTGHVLISGVTPSEAVSRWPGAIAYVPQDIAVIAGAVRANVAIGLPPELIDDEAVWQALQSAQLADFFRHEREGLDTLVGEHGVRLSGGQRQRLGVARALYSKPRFLVLDEATSALDAETEVSVTRALQSLGTDVTRIVIAHRLATVRDCDQVAYLHGGHLECVGAFEQVRAAVPNFDRQAQLLGL
jgi:ABC-type multidrug transport system fused ATPase/permease subunit